MVRGGFVRISETNMYLTYRFEATTDLRMGAGRNASTRSPHDAKTPMTTVNTQAFILDQTFCGQGWNVVGTKATTQRKKSAPKASLEVKLEIRTSSENVA